MRFAAIALLLLAWTAPVLAWNAAGHRLSAVIAWQAITPATRDFVSDALARHPDHRRWREKSGRGEEMLVFAEASVWADSIRSDPRYYDERRQRPTPPIPGLPDHARHSDWHYANMHPQGTRGPGRIDRQIEALNQLLRSTDDTGQIAWALPWLAHLIGDIHQPLHTGYRHDAGGNKTLIEDPFARGQPFTDLHTWWDRLPGPAGLRGKRLRAQAGRLLARHAPPPAAGIAEWLAESRALLDACYPSRAGSVLPLIDENFRQQAQRTSERQIAASGYRLANLLEEIRQARVSRGTR